MFYWGIVIVFSAFMIQFISFGLAASIGVYNIELLDYFGSSTAATSLIGSINIAFVLGAGPLASFLMNKLSYRCVALIGAVLSSGGLLLSPFAPNIEYLCIFYGVFTGLGFCFLYMPSHVLSGLYFEKHRCLATGIATSGSGLGGFAFPVIIHYLIEEYTWRGSMLILAGVSLHNFILAWLLRPVEMYLPNKNKSVESDDREQMISKNIPKLYAKADVDVSLTENEQLIPEERTIADGELPENDLQVLSENKLKIQAHETMLQEKIVKVDHVIPGENGQMIQKHEICVVDKMVKSDLLASGENEKVIQKIQPGNTDTSQKKKRKNCYVLCSISFLIYFFNNMGWNIGAVALYVLGPEYFLEVSLDKGQAAWAFTMIGLGTFIGSVFGSVLGNIKWINRMGLYITTNIFIGVISILITCPLVHTFAGICCVNFAWGLLFGILLALLVVVTADILSVELLGDGMGYLMLANGIGCTIGPPLAGWIKDVSGSLFLSFLANGLLILLSAMIMVLIPVRKKLCKKSSQHKLYDKELVICPPSHN